MTVLNFVSLQLGPFLVESFRYLRLFSPIKYRYMYWQISWIVRRILFRIWISVLSVGAHTTPNQVNHLCILHYHIEVCSESPAGIPDMRLV